MTDLKPYLLVDIVYIHQIYLLFTARLQARDFHPTLESAEVKLMRQAEIPWDAIAFTVIEKTLQYYFQDRPRNQFRFRIDRIDLKS